MLIILILLALLVACEKNPEKPVSGGNQEELEAKEEVKKSFHIKDEELEKLIRQELNKPDGKISQEDMKAIRELTIDNSEYSVKELDGLDFAVNLEYLELFELELKSLEPIANLGKIEYFSLAYSEVEDMPSKFNMPNLINAVFMEVNIRDFSFIKDSPLRSLVFDYCELEDLDFLADKDLEYLRAQYNMISDISLLENMPNLKSLIIRGNKVTDINVLSSCSNLEYLDISNNPIENIAVVRDLEKLEEIVSYGAPLTNDDIKLLKELEEKGIEVCF